MELEKVSHANGIFWLVRTCFVRRDSMGILLLNFLGWVETE